MTTKKLCLVHGDKGGVGKTVFSRLLMQYVIDRGIPFDAYDCDDNMDLYRHYPELVNTISFERVEEFAKILDYLMDGQDGAPLAMLDLAAGQRETVANWLVNSGALEAARRRELEIIVCFMLGASTQSAMLLQRTFEQLGKDVRWVVVKNCHGAADFDAYDNGARLRPQLKASGAIEIYMGSLSPAIMTEIDRGNMSFAKARAELTFTKRGFLNTWLDGIYKQLDDQKDLLGRPQVEAAAPA